MEIATKNETEIDKQTDQLIVARLNSNTQIAKTGTHDKTEKS